MPFCPNCGAGTSGENCEVCGHKAPPLKPIEPVAPPKPQLPQMNIGLVVGSAFRDAGAVMREHMTPMIVMAVIVTLFGSLMFLGVHNEDQRVTSIALAADIFLVVVVFYAIAASVRTIQPSFRLTVSTWFGTVGWLLLVGLLTFAAELAFIIPALWVSPKLSLTPFIYLLTEGQNNENPLGRSWRITTGHYWSTVGLTLLAMLPGFVCVALVYLFANLTMLTGLAGAIVAIPLLCFGFGWSYQVYYLALTRWTYLLLQHDVERRTAPLTA